MLLVFDVGNTNMVLGLYEGKELIKYWRINTDKEKTSDEYGILISNLFQYEKIDMGCIEDVIISSVVPSVMHSLENFRLFFAVFYTKVFKRMHNTRNYR